MPFDINCTLANWLLSFLSAAFWCFQYRYLCFYCRKYFATISGDILLCRLDFVFFRFFFWFDIRLWYHFQYTQVNFLWIMYNFMRKHRLKIEPEMFGSFYFSMFDCTSNLKRHQHARTHTHTLYHNIHLLMLFNAIHFHQVIDDVTHLPLIHSMINYENVIYFSHINLIYLHIHGYSNNIDDDNKKKRQFF